MLARVSGGISPTLLAIEERRQPTFSADGVVRWLGGAGTKNAMSFEAPDWV